MTDKNSISRPGSTDVNQVRHSDERPQRERPVDLVFVLDTTGSMEDKIDGLLASCATFVDEFGALKLDHRIAVVAFGDLTVPGDRIVATKFTNNLETTKKSLKIIPRYDGGGNEGESSLDAILKAMKLPFREKTVKVLVLITDEPALQHGNITSSACIRQLTAREFLVFVMSPPINYFKSIAHKTGGKWYEISDAADFSELLKMFAQIAKSVTKIVSDVHLLGKGSVANYLQLKGPEK